MKSTSSMRRIIHVPLLWTLILFACSPSLSHTESIPPTPTIFPTVTHFDQSNGNCAYQWATQDLPELTSQFDSAVKAAIFNSTSHASAFGENCIGKGGQVIRFGAMETDFYIVASVDAITDYETFGNWIAQVMQITNSMPPDLLKGPNKGFVEFRFEKSQTETISFRVSIQQYNDSTNGISGEKLFRMFYKAP